MEPLFLRAVCWADSVCFMLILSMDLQSISITVTVQKKNSLWKSLSTSRLGAVAQVRLPVNHVSTTWELARTANKCLVFASLYTFWILDPCLMYSREWFSMLSPLWSLLLVSFPIHVISQFHVMLFVHFWGYFLCNLNPFQKVLAETYILKEFY